MGNRIRHELGGFAGFGASEGRFNTIHNIQPDVPPEDIVAMFEALEEYNTASS